MATGLYCPDYGLMDYLRGHLPVDSDAELKFSFPQKSEEPTQPESKVDKTGIVFLAADSVGLVPKEQIVRLSTESHLNDLLPNDVDSTACVVNYKAEEALKALYQQYPQSQANPVAALFLLRTVDGLKGSLDARLRLVQLRLKSLYILVNSRATDPQYQTVLKSNGLFVRDLLALSDISSEGAHDIKQYDASLAVSTLALDCVVNILKCVHRRKGPLIKIGIERHLGIVLRNNDPNADLHTFEHIGGFHETLWVSILLSACASVDAHFTDVIMNSQLKPVILMTPTNRYVAVDRSRICSASYLRSALELFGTVLNMYDQFEFSGEGSLVGAMATVLQHSAGYCKCLLAQLRVSIDANDYASVDTTLYDNEEYFWAIAKGLACLIVSFGRQGFLSSMMECDLLTFFSNLLEAFSDSSILSSKLVGTSLKNIPDKVLHLLSQYVAHGGRRAVPTGGDSGIQVLQQVFFGSLCSQALLCPVSQLWSRIFLVTRSAISAEPTYLAQYIKSPHAEALKLALINKNFSSDSLFNENIDKFLPNLAKLLHSLCITADGQTFLRDSNAVPFIVDCLVNPDLLMPNSAGLTVETLKVCANQISYIMRDCAPLRLSIRVSLQNLILKVCREVYDHAKTSANGDGESDERSQALQKLFNLCSFIENMGTDGRRQSADIFREIFSEDILAALLRTYPCTLPPPRRLFAQLSVRNVPGHSPIYGHFPSSKALNNVIKIVASVNAQSLIQVLFRNIDEILANISSFKTELCTMTSSTSSLASLSEDSDAHVYSEPVKSNRKHKKRDLAADSDQVSLGGIKKAVAGTVHILGVLDRVPHMCAFDPRLTSGSASISDAEETAIWNFLVATLSFEWSLTQLSYVIRFTQKNQGQNQNIITVAHKDYIRRIFAFHRSALLEVCRFAATKQSPKVKFFTQNSFIKFNI